MLLEKWRFGVRLAPWGVAQRQNHHRKFMDGTFASPRKNPADDEERQKDEPDKKVITMFVNQGIHELGRPRDIYYRVIHTNPSGFFSSLHDRPRKRRASFMLKQLVVNL